MKSTKTILGLLVLAAAAFSASNAKAYILSGNEWPGSKPRVPFYISNNLNGNLPYDGSFSQAVTAINNAANQWSTAGGAEAKFTYAGTTDVSTAADDGVNVIIFSNSQCPYGSGCLAATIPYQTNGVIRGFDIILYKYRGTDGAMIGWSIKSIPYPCDTDVWSIVMHELGHGIGINHSNMSGVVMGTNCGTGCNRHYLYNDDKNAIKGAYGIYSNEGFWADNSNPTWGDTVNLSLNYPQAFNTAYAILVSTTPGSTPLNTINEQDSRILQIYGNFLPIENYPSMFVSFTGTLDETGQGVAKVKLPVSPYQSPVGGTIYLTVVTLSCQYLNCYEDVGVGVSLNLPEIPHYFPTIKTATSVQSTMAEDR